MMKKVFSAILLLFSIFSFSQFSKTHYIPPLSNSDSQVPNDQYLYVSCPSLTNVDFKITKIGGQTISGTVSRDKPYTLNIGSGLNTQLMIGSSNVGTVMRNKGYIVEAEDMVYVTVRLTATPESWQAGGLVSKGLAALGTQFRIGAFTNTAVAQTSDSHYTFATILATENNTTVSFGDIKAGVTLINKAGVGNKPPSITLNRGESYAIAVQGPKDNKGVQNFANRDALVGASITSDKPIAVNCGSFAGTNGDSNLDLGFDQIVSAERTGTDYIFIKGNGIDIVEKPLIIANEDDTKVYLDGSSIPFTTLNPSKGQKYLALDGSYFSANGNLYVRTSKNAFAYQGIGGTQDEANQNMHFVPPLSCETPKIINNIPLINSVGDDSGFTGTVCVVTEAGAALDIMVNGNKYPITALPTGIQAKGPLNVSGNSKYVTYTLKGLKGNIGVFSTKQVYLSYFGSSGHATYGGFYSGFTFKPEVSFKRMDLKSADCIPNIRLSVNELTAFNDFQWFKNGDPISGAVGSEYVPTEPGFYSVRASITECGTSLFSDNIPVSSCPGDMDDDGVNDNADIDNDNDGITNCTESLGSKDINLSSNTGAINQGNYNNSFTRTETVTGTNSPNAFTGKADGTFVSEATAGKGNSVKQTFTFAKPISLSLEYITAAINADLLSSNGDFILEVPVGNTITVLNPTDQLLIDTNYDGVYESGITEYSSFQLRFRLNNGGKALAAGTGMFKFLARLVSSFSITHKDLSDSVNSRASFKFTSTCLPKDTDNDGIANEIDLDDDNDGIPDLVEVLGKDYAIIPFKDKNEDGLNDAYAPGLGTLDTDKGGVSDYLDLDSDDDGIYDLVEAGHKASDLNKDGVIDGSPASFGANGYLDSLETPADSGIMNFTLASTDNDGYQNYIDSDSDADGCNDVIEAGFSDKDGDGYLGEKVPPLIDANGKVTSASNGYIPLLNDNYIVPKPLTITTQPAKQLVACEGQPTKIIIESADAEGYLWQVSTDGTNYSNIADGTVYSGSKTSTLTLIKATPAMNGYKYKALLSRAGNLCGLVSDEASLSILVSPKVKPVITLVQCDDNTDALTDFNLKQKENDISANYASETFTYFTSLAAAKSNDANFKIDNPTIYNNSKGNTVWARVENANGCFSISEIHLQVSITQIPAGTVFKFSKCDDYVDVQHDDKDGVSSFDLSSVTASIIAMLPADTYQVKYYKTQQQALQETDEQGNSLAIADVSNYRNSSSPQTIWVRIENSIPNSCSGLGPFVQLAVDALPDIETTHSDIICAANPEAIQLNAGIAAASENNYDYIWQRNEQPLATAKNSYLMVASDGIYTCAVVDKKTGCQRLRTNTVTYAKAIEIKEVAISDLKEHNTVTVISSDPAHSEFSLDNPTGPFYDSNVFEDVEPGIHIVYINDKSGCGVVSKTIAVVGAPPFFTPNGDSYNDTWKLIGVSSQFYKNSVVEIFDRFGKLIKVLPNAESEGWDGTYQGYALPSDDYWFVVHLDGGREGKGHFALKR